LLVTRYPKTLEIAKNTIKYKKYLLVNNLEASLVKLIVFVYILYFKKIDIKYINEKVAINKINQNKI